MATAAPVAIDTHHLLQRWQSFLETHLAKTDFELHRVCFHATVVPDVASTLPRHNIWQGIEASLGSWQADQAGDPGDDVEGVEEVLYNLAQVSRSSIFAAGTHLVTNFCSPTFGARAKGRPPSAYHRYSLRSSWFQTIIGRNELRSGRGHHIDMRNFFERIQTAQAVHWVHSWNIIPQIVWAGSIESRSASVLWNLQVDFVDLGSRTPRRLRKQNRRAINPFLKVSEGSTRRDTVSRSFNGVRSKRKRWWAETRLPKHKNTVWIGEFKSQIEAARAVDVAFHHYGRADQLNFEDTPGLLAALPTVPDGCSEEDKLNLVKEQARLLASMAFTLPSSPSTSSWESDLIRSRSETIDSSSGVGGDSNVLSQPLGQVAEYSIAKEAHALEPNNFAVNEFQMLEDYLAMSPTAFDEFLPRRTADLLLDQRIEELSRSIVS